MDGTFVPAKKGGLAWERHAKARGRSAWFWPTARVFLSECTFRLRWIVERTNAWLFNFRRLVVRYEHKLENFRAFLHLACALIALRELA